MSKAQQIYATKARILIDNFDVMKDNGKLVNAVLKGIDKDVQVRDYAMGLTRADNLGYYLDIWTFLTDKATNKNAPTTIKATVLFEMGNKPDALTALEVASPTYSLAQLLTRVVAAGWSPEAWSAMRKELHPKVEDTIYDSKEN